jgi:hypothetical protein
MGMYVSQHVKDSLLQVIITSPLEKPGQYKYSDLGMILLQRVIETLGGMEWMPTSIPFFTSRWDWRIRPSIPEPNFA